MRLASLILALAGGAACARDGWTFRPLDGSAPTDGPTDAAADLPLDVPTDVPTDVPADLPAVRRGVTQVLQGPQVTFALRDDGAVFAAGQGAGAFEGVEGAHRNTFVRVQGFDGVEELSLASTLPLVLCGRGADGAVRCKQGAVDPVVVRDLGDARQISGRCALRQDGAVACWSVADYRAVPVDLPRDVTAVASNGDFHCALRRGGTVRCWGAVGAVLDVPTPSSRSAATPEDVPGVSTAAAIAVGAESACAALQLGAVVCWGRRRAIHRGPNENVGATAIEGARDARTLTAIAALRADGRVMVWGTGELGARGDGTYTPTASAVVVPNLSARRLADGDTSRHVCAALEGGALWCWGSDEWGQLGRGGALQRWPQPARANPEDPADLTALGDVVDVVHAAPASCALRRDGTVSCWGAEDNGTLGNGVQRRAPPWRLRPTTVPGLRGVAALGHYGSTAGPTFGARLGDGTLRVWGEGAGGAIGNGAFATRTTPTEVARVTDAARLVVGISHLCAVRADRTVACWGHGTSGELGDGSSASAASPVAVSGLTDVVDLALGPDVSVALRGDGSMRLWGLSNGVLATARAYSTPTPLPDLAEVTQVIAVMPHDWRQVCALQRSGRVHCMGQNLPRPGAWFDMGLEDVTQIAGSPAAVGCARHGNGTVSCWGINRNSCLGDPSLPNTDDYLPPQRVLNEDGTPFTGVRVVRPGIGSVCAVREDDTLWCWGSQGNGVSGRGFTQWSASPRPALGL